MKTCFRCEERQPISEFYKHKGMKDGHLNKCKTCTKKDSRKRETAPETADAVREYKRIWARERGRDKREAYERSEAGKKSGNKSKSEYRKRNPKRRYAHSVLRYAIKTGQLARPSSCEKCGDKESSIHGHHCDYLKPLDVMWLCPSCHSEWHRQNESINGD